MKVLRGPVGFTHSHFWLPSDGGIFLALVANAVRLVHGWKHISMMRNGVCFLFTSSQTSPSPATSALRRDHTFTYSNLLLSTPKTLIVSPLLCADHSGKHLIRLSAMDISFDPFAFVASLLGTFFTSMITVFLSLYQRQPRHTVRYINAPCPAPAKSCVADRKQRGLVIVHSVATVRWIAEGTRRYLC